MRDFASAPSLDFPVSPWLVLTWIAAAMLMLADPARAITISQAEYQRSELRRDMLVVEGKTEQPNQPVVLDDRFREWSDHLGHFSFRVPYLPADCMVQLKVGQTVRQVVIANCTRGDDSAETPTEKTAPPQPRAITISRGEYQRSELRRDMLVVEGKTQQPKQRVVLDDRFTEWSDRLGHFSFRVPYLPADCMVQLKAGQNVRQVVIANCTRTDDSAEMPTEKTAPPAR